MARTRIDLDSRGMREVLTSQGVRAALRDEAEQIAARARANAPVRTGRYRDSIRVVSDTTDRAVERVISDVRIAMLVESRTGNLRRAMGG